MALRGEGGTSVISHQLQRKNKKGDRGIERRCGDKNQQKCI
jgi:hypothetical protein